MNERPASTVEVTVDEKDPSVVHAEIGVSLTHKEYAGLCVVNPNCRLCGRKLSDMADLWAGRCNNDEACKTLVEANK